MKIYILVLSITDDFTDDVIGDVIDDVWSRNRLYILLWTCEWIQL